MDKALIPLAAFKGLGPKSTAALHSIGITSMEQLTAEDPYDVYAKLKKNVPGVSLNFLYAIMGAVENVHWQEIKRHRRTSILLRLEDLGIAPK